MQNKFHLSRSDFAEKFLYLNGQPFSLADYPHMRTIYNTTAREVVMKFSRQTTKSSTLANLIITNSITIPYFKSMYVSPTVKQTKLFSQERVGPVIESSPLLKTHFVNASVTQNVFTKTFLNGSTMHLLYALLDADKLRGYSIDHCMFDEVQSLKEEVIPIIKESMSRSLYKHTWYAGTPLRSRGTLAKLWNNSSKTEYTLKCPHCGHWNVLGEDNIGPIGNICSKCAKRLVPKECKTEWVSTYSLTQTPDLEGYRVCLLHFDGAPWVNWEEDVIRKRQNISKAAFLNEVLALEYDEGVSPVTEMQLQSCCNPNRLLTVDPKPGDLVNNIMGVDYGPINSENSHTVIAVWHRNNDKYVCVYAKKFIGKEADYSYIHKEIPRLMQVWNCSHLAADYGMGEASNAEIRSKVGYERVIAFQHQREQKEKVKWNSKMPAYTLGRSSVMSDLFRLIHHNKIEFPRWDYFKPFAEDILNIQQEHDEDLGKVKFTSIGPDDFFHASLYAILSLEMMSGENKLISS